MDASPDFPPLVHGLAEIAAASEGIHPDRLASLLARTRPRYVWHVALTDPGIDKQAEDGLRRRGYRVERAKIYAWRPKRGGGRREIVKSMFPGYQFVLPCPNGWEALRESPGVYGLMRIGDRFVTFDDDDREFRRIWEVEAQLREAPQKVAKYRVGQRVRVAVPVAVGPPQDVFANIAALDDKGRIDVLLDAAKRKIRMRTTQEFLNPA